MPDFLLEIGLEEIPSRMLAAAQKELAERVESLLREQRLLESSSQIVSYSTPRRLAALASGLKAQQSDVQEEVVGPSWKIAWQQDAFSAAATAFARKVGVSVDALRKVATPKGEYVGATVLRRGEAASAILAAMLPACVSGLYWPKNMYWREGKPERFVRPVRWLIAMLDSTVIPFSFAGQTAAASTRGHRILHGDEPVLLQRATDYAQRLREVFVLVDPAERRHVIRKALDRVTRIIPQGRWREDEELIETVVHLTEWPTVLCGTFESEYLGLPQEVLVTVMRDHQKFFAVEGAGGALLPYFLTVLNTEVDDEGQAIIRHGNERVLRSRFKDAQFFWNADQKIPLTERVELLRSVTFQKDLGSYFWKTEQNLRIAEVIGKTLQSRGKVLDHVALLQAVLLAKTDLTAELVKEFTELQGIVGGLYAQAQGLSETVASAIYAQYLPASSEDPIPQTIEAQITGLVDRMQTIAAMFSIGNIPSGSRDPFALRRAGNAIVRILAESAFPLRLSELIAATGQPEASVALFLRERLGFYLKENRGFAYDVIAAVMASDADDVPDACARCEALSAVRGSTDFMVVAAAYKRIRNILEQARQAGNKWAEADDRLLTEPEEQALFAASARLAAQVCELRALHQYRQALEAIASLAPSVDAFFSKIMVMTPDAALRAARLRLIESVLVSISGIADFAEIVQA